MMIPVDDTLVAREIGVIKMGNKNYTVYHLHTQLSLLDSTTKHSDYIARAVELGQTAIAFTEHGHIYQWVEKKMACEKAGDRKSVV